MKEKKHIFKNWQEKLGTLTINRKILVFGLFLLISAVLWLLNALNKEYSTRINYPIAIKNLPAEIRVSNDLPDHLSLKIQGHGYDILSHTLDHSRAPLVVDLKDYHLKLRKEDCYFLLTNKLYGKARRVIKGELSLLSIEPDTIFFKYQRNVSRKLPVRLYADYKIAQQHMLISDVKISPDSVVVTGPKNLVREMTDYPTSYFDLGTLKDTLNRNIPLMKKENLSCKPNRVNVIFEVSKYTEAHLGVSLNIEKLPDSLSIRLIPRNVTASFKVPVEKYKQVSRKDFILEVDFDHKSGQYLYPELVVFPDYVQDVELSPEKVKFILTKTDSIQ